MTKVSIVLPVYNVEQYLRQCLDSIINQTFKDFECICVNDGSTDSSLQILQEYAKKDKRFKIISQENRGLSAARNTGLQMVQSPYVTFIDSDDWILDKYIEVLYKNITLRHYDIACACHQCYYEDTNDYKNSKNISKIKNILYKKYTNLEDKINIIDSSRNVWNKIYKNSFIKENRLNFFEDIYSAEDYAFNFLSFLYTDKYVFCDDNLYFYRKRTNSLTNNDEKIRIETLKSFLKIMEALINRNFNDKLFTDIYIKLLYYHIGKISKNVSMMNKKLLIDKTKTSIKTFIRHQKNINMIQNIKLNTILFLFKIFKTKSLMFFRILKNF